MKTEKAEEEQPCTHTHNRNGMTKYEPEGRKESLCWCCYSTDLLLTGCGFVALAALDIMSQLQDEEVG